MVVSLAFAVCVRAQLTTAQARIGVDLSFGGSSIPAPIQATALQEVRRIWAPYGVDIRESLTTTAGDEDRVRLAVSFSDVSDVHPPATVLGSIHFLGGTPDRVIVIHPAAIERLVSTTSLSGRAYREWPMGLRLFIQGRVLGRALAHEIGHYLLRSTLHARTGLMRPDLAPADMVAADPRGFTLSAADEARLTGVIRHQDTISAALSTD